MKTYMFFFGVIILLVACEQKVSDECYVLKNDYSTDYLWFSEDEYYREIYNETEDSLLYKKSGAYEIETFNEIRFHGFLVNDSFGSSLDFNDNGMATLTVTNRKIIVDRDGNVFYKKITCE